MRAQPARVAIVFLAIALLLACPGCDLPSSNRQDKEIQKVLSDRTLTFSQASHKIAAIRTKYAVKQFLLPGIEIVVVTAFATRVGLQARKRVIEKRLERERYLRRCERQRRNMEELYAPPPPKPEDPFGVLQKRVSAIPVEERAVSFFTSRPFHISDAIETTVLVGYQPVVVQATREEALEIKAGRTPLVRSFVIDGVAAPWYQWAGYAPFLHYWAAASNNWTWINSLVTAGWTSTDYIDPETPGYNGRPTELSVDWQEATRRRSGVLYRWSLEKRPLVKALNPSLAASFRPHRSISAACGVNGSLDVLGLSRRVTTPWRRKARPSGDAYVVRARTASDNRFVSTNGSRSSRRDKRLRKSLNVKKPVEPLVAPKEEASAKRGIQHKALPSPVIARTAQVSTHREGRSRTPSVSANVLATPSNNGHHRASVEQGTAEAIASADSSDAPPFPVAWKEQIRSLHKELEETIRKAQSLEVWDDVDDVIETDEGETVDTQRIHRYEPWSPPTEYSALDAIEPIVEPAPDLPEPNTSAGEPSVADVLPALSAATPEPFVAEAPSEPDAGASRKKPRFRLRQRSAQDEELANDQPEAAPADVVESVGLAAIEAEIQPQLVAPAEPNATIADSAASNEAKRRFRKSLRNTTTTIIQQPVIPPGYAPLPASAPAPVLEPHGNQFNSRDGNRKAKVDFVELGDVVPYPLQEAPELPVTDDAVLDNGAVEPSQFEPRPAPARPYDDEAPRLVRNAPGANRMPANRRRRSAAAVRSLEASRSANSASSSSGKVAQGRSTDPDLVAHIIANPALRHELNDFIEDLLQRNPPDIESQADREGATI